MDTIQKALVKAGRKDLAQKYYKKIAALNKEDWVDDKAKKEKMLKEVMEERGKMKDLTSQLSDLFGEILPWFLDIDKNLQEFWDMNHAFWGHDVKIGRKGKDIYLIDWQGNVLQIQLKTKVIK